MLLTANIFQPLIDVFEAVLKFFHNSVGISWGFSIVLLTAVIRLLLVPLTLKQFHSMQAMQRLQPELKALQSKYKEDKQRQQQEMMKFYKENDVNPLGSCLPLVAQLPVFISLFYMLKKSLRIDICAKLQPHHIVNGKSVVDLAHTKACGPHGGAGFLFVNDLTNNAAGATLVVLIVLYVGTQLASSLMMSSPTMDQTQRRIMLFMPLFFVVFIINFPAGVIVYWVTTNSWTMVQQYVFRRRIGHMGPPLATAGGGDSGGAGPGGGGRPGGASRPRGGGGKGPGGDDGGNGGSAAGGLAGLLRGRSKSSDEESAPVGGSRSRTAAPPPPPPRKKKKRSGRRR
jgi:YidC/Oxa1 family membrane protein insertase